MTLNEKQQKELISWVNREINLTQQHINMSQRGIKKFHEGYQHALKKVQARLNGHHLKQNVKQTGEKE